MGKNPPGPLWPQLNSPLKKAGISRESLAYDTKEGKEKAKPAGTGGGREVGRHPVGARPEKKVGWEAHPGGCSRWALGTSERLSLTYSLQLDAALLFAVPPVPARGLNFVDDSHKRLKGHLDPASLAWLQQPRGGQHLERA